MIPKDLLVILTSAKQDAALDAAEQLAQRWKSHISALHLSLLPDIGSADLLWAEVVTQLRDAATKDRVAIEQRLARQDAPFDLRRQETMIGSAGSIAGMHALHADLSILTQPEDGFAQAAFEGALFRSGRPVLIMPPQWSGQAPGKRIVVAWRAKREAARALADAAPFLAQAEAVKIVTVDAIPGDYGEGPGRDIATHLARHGLSVELSNLDSSGRAVEGVLLEAADAFQADLIVMGGFGHARLTEFVFGGVTRALMRAAPTPLLMSH